MNFSRSGIGKRKKLPVIVVRLFNTVGPRQTGRYGMVLPNFVKSALEDSPIHVYGNGQQSRCFCDVRDTVESLVRLMDTDKSVGEVINVGNTEEVTITALAQRVKKLTASALLRSNIFLTIKPTSPVSKT